MKTTDAAVPMGAAPRHRRRQDPTPWNTLPPYARQRLAVAFAELAVHKGDFAAALLALARCAPGEGHRDLLRLHSAEQRGHAELCLRYAARLRPQSGPGDGGFPQPGRAGTCAAELGPGWYAALVRSCLTGEGALVTAALGALRDAARAACVPSALDDDLAAMAREDAVRHAHVVAVVRDGVLSGHAERVARAHGEGVEATVRALVQPRRRTMTPMVPVALAQRAALLSSRWDAVRDRLVAQLALIGLESYAAETRRRWDAAQARALDEYRDRWGAPHVVRRAAAAGLLPAPGALG
ncbi:hypothetical protein ACFYMW_02195 [Streptomyces sp. NPDC006692]|uniref:hypothetical protein n=1 Tax=Streptomyces sp. NPDC006692 TaxID=3364758 RepID=UPI0036CB0CCE